MRFLATCCSGSRHFPVSSLSAMPAPPCCPARCSERSFIFAAHLRISRPRRAILRSARITFQPCACACSRDEASLPPILLKWKVYRKGRRRNLQQRKPRKAARRLLRAEPERPPQNPPPFQKKSPCRQL